MTMFKLKTETSLFPQYQSGENIVTGLKELLQSRRVNEDQQLIRASQSVEVFMLSALCHAVTVVSILPLVCLLYAFRKLLVRVHEMI